MSNYRQCCSFLSVDLGPSLSAFISNRLKVSADLWARGFFPKETMAPCSHSPSSVFFRSFLGSFSGGAEDVFAVVFFSLFLMSGS